GSVHAAPGDADLPLLDALPRPGALPRGATRPLGGGIHTVRGDARRPRARRPRRRPAHGGHRRLALVARSLTSSAVGKLVIDADRAAGRVDRDGAQVDVVLARRELAVRAVAGTAGQDDPRALGFRIGAAVLRQAPAVEFERAIRVDGHEREA